MAATKEETDRELRRNNGTTNVPNFRSRNFFFTWNNYNGSTAIDDIEQWLQTANAKYVMQPETGESGTPHLQGTFQLPNARWRNAIAKRFPGIHLEKTRSIEGAKAYCQKSETADEERKIYCSANFRIVKDPLRGRDLYEWQRYVLKLIRTDPDDRSIHWFWEPTGNAGKTALAKSICLQFNAIYVSGKSSDINYAITQCEKSSKGIPKIFIFDYPRSYESYVSYGALEKVKDGIVFSAKYESRMLLFNAPHVICFANFHPDLSKLSRDRWHIINISNDEAIARTRFKNLKL